MQAQTSLDSICLEDVLKYTQTDSFAINSLYKVISKNIEKGEKLKVKIEGAISDPDFSFAIVSMLPALKRQMENRPTLELIYYKTDEKDFEEVLVINAIAQLYPSKYFDYLIARAKYGFVEAWVRVANEMSLDINKINSFILSLENKLSAEKSFTSKLYDEYRVKVNEEEVILIKNFYEDIFDKRIQSASTPYFRCITDAFYLTTTRFLKGGFFTKSDSTLITDLYRENPNEMYFELLNCMADSKILNFYRTDNNAESRSSWMIDKTLTHCLKGEFKGVASLAISKCSMGSNYFNHQKYKGKVKIGFESKIEWGKIHNSNNK